MVSQKIKISVVSGLIAAVINLPQVYGITNKLLPFDTLKNGCPTSEGRLAHLLVFVLITYLSMKQSKLDEKEIWHNSIFSAVILYFIFSNDIVSIIGKVFGVKLVNNGCVNIYGISVQVVLYILALYGVMFF
jgi:hypothetical protein